MRALRQTVATVSILAASHAGAEPLDPWIAGDDGQRNWDPVAAAIVRSHTPDEGEAAWRSIEEAHGLMWTELRARGAGDTLPPIHSIDSAEDWAEVGELLSTPRMAEAMKQALLASRGNARASVPVALPECETWRTILVGMPVRGLSETADMVWLLAVDAAAAGRSGDIDRAARSISAALRLSAGITEPPILLSIRIRARCFESILPVLEHLIATEGRAINGEGLAELADGLERISISVGWKSASNTEPILLEDAVRRMLDDEGRFSLGASAGVLGFFRDEGDSEACVGPATSCPIGDWTPGVEDVILRSRFAAETAARCLEPGWRQEDEAVLREYQAWVMNGTEESMPVELAACRSIASLLDPDWLGSTRLVRLYEQRLTGARIAVAAHRHRLRAGAFPESLEVMGEDLLGAVPTDVYSGDPLKLLIVGDGVRVYSVGPDGDDDGGVHLTDEFGLPAIIMAPPDQEKPQNGDWLLWPSRNPSP